MASTTVSEDKFPANTVDLLRHFDAFCCDGDRMWSVVGAEVYFSDDGGMTWTRQEAKKIVDSDPDSLRDAWETLGL